MMILLLFLSMLVQQPASTESGTLAGQLLDGKGVPAAGVRISAMPVESGATADNAGAVISNFGQTDNSGRYRLEGVRPGRYRIMAGILVAPTYYPGGTMLDQGRIVTITAGQTLTDLNFTIASVSAIRPVDLASPPPGALPGQVKGWVSMDDGSPLPGRPIRNLRMGIDGNVTIVPISVTTGFTLSGLQSGPHVVTVAQFPISQFGYYLKSMTFGNVDLTKNPMIVQPAWTSTEIQIVLTRTRPGNTPPGVLVNGRITNLDFPFSADLPLELLDISIPASSNQTVADLKADRKSGFFEISGVPPGSYAIRTQPPGTRALESSVPFNVSGSDLTNMEVILRGGSATPVPSTSNSIWSGNSTITGTVETLDGTIPEFEIGFTPTREGAATHAVAVLNGRFSIMVPTGEYRVSISGVPKGYTVESIKAGALDLAGPFLVTSEGIADRAIRTAVPAGNASSIPAMNAAITVRLVPFSGQ